MRDRCGAQAEGTPSLKVVHLPSSVYCVQSLPLSLIPSARLSKEPETTSLKARQTFCFQGQNSFGLRSAASKRSAQLLKGQRSNPRPALLFGTFHLAGAAQDVLLLNKWAELDGHHPVYRRRPRPFYVLVFVIDGVT